MERLSISPPSAAESLFLGPATPNNDVVGGAAALFRKLQNSSNEKQRVVHVVNGRLRKSGSFSSAHTRSSNVSSDDFHSCVETSSDMDSIDSTENNNYVSPTAAARSSRFSMETIDDTTSSDDTMANKKNRKNNTKTTKVVDTTAVTVGQKPPLPDVALAPDAAPAPSVGDAPVTDDDQPPMKVDAAEVVYGKAKEILLWGKSVPVVSFFVGTSEAVVGKALGVVGTDLSQVDGKIESELTKFDAGILNPAIEAIAKVLIGVAGKSEETLRPIIDILLKPFGKLIKSDADEDTPEAHTENPEITN